MRRWREGVEKQEAHHHWSGAGRRGPRRWGSSPLHSTPYDEIADTSAQEWLLRWDSCFAGGRTWLGGSGTPSSAKSSAAESFRNSSQVVSCSCPPYTGLP